MPRRPPPPEPPKRRRRGTGSIVTLKDGTIRARLPADLDPKRTAREFRPGELDAAVAWLDAALHPETVETTTAIVTLGEWAGTWHEVYVAPVRSPSTAKWYLYALRELAELYTVSLTDLRTSGLQTVIAQLAGRLDAATVQGIAGVWRRCLDAAVEDEHLTRNPARRLVVPRASPRLVKRHVTPEEVAALWPAIRGHRFEAAYALLLGCGLRIGEVLGLGWADVDLHERRALVRRQWTNSHWRNIPKGHRPRHVRLPERVVAALIRHRNGQPEGAVLVLQSPHMTLWGPTKRKHRKPEVRPWSAQVVRRDLAELIDATPHAFRRGLVTALLDGGVSPAVVAEIAGHADQATTLRSYAGRSTEARRQAEAVVDRYLGDSTEGASGTETAG